MSNLNLKFPAVKMARIVDKMQIKKIVQTFEEYIVSNNAVSRKTLRNYRCDIRHFLGWLFEQFDFIDAEKVHLYIRPEIVEEYKDYQKKQHYPISTINRRLATLRNFARFLEESGKIERVDHLIQNIAQETNPEKMLADYKAYLTKNKVAKATVRTYISDVRQFFAWLAQNGKI